MPMGIMEACMSLTVGRLIDARVPPRFLVGFSNLLQCLIILSMPHINSTPRAIAMGLTRGIYQGVNGPLRSTLIPMFFGRKHIGKIQGVQTMIQIAGTAIGPLLLGIGHAVTGELY